MKSECKYFATPDLITLSDLFRRSAIFDNHEHVSELVELGRQFSNALTWIYPEYDFDNGVNIQAAKHMVTVLEQMDKAAIASGLNTIILPISENSYEWKFLKESVLSRISMDTSVAFKCAKRRYSKDLSDVGSINEYITTMLTPSGVFGNVSSVLCIDDKIKRQWRTEIKYGDQLSLEL